MGIREAVRILRASGSVSVYIDAGNARWHAPAKIAERLRQAGIDQATGFALNVSTDLEAFHGLDPCGFDASVMTSLGRELDRPVTVDEARGPIGRAVADALAQVTP